MRPDILTRAAFATVASVAVLAQLAGCSGSDPDSPTAGSSATASTSAPNGSSTPEGAAYRDGTYNAIGEYGGGPSHLDVTVTIGNNTVTDVAVKPMAENDTSRGYQERFAAAVPAEVVGKSLNEAEVGKLAGASTCPDGFNDAIRQIREKARAGQGG